MKRLIRLSLVVCLATVCFTGMDSHTARAEVVSSGAGGFHLRIDVAVDVSAERSYRAVTEEVGKWWDKNHTYSLDASNLYFEARPHGWFGEKLPDGGFVRHMEIAYLAPNKTIRLLGGLGPLQGLGLQGAMTIEFQPDGEDAARVKLTYIVTGYSQNGLEKLAPIVDQVLTGQLRRLKSYVETGQP